MEQAPCSRFQFVTVAHPEEIKDRKNQGEIRRHAIRNSIQRKIATRTKNNVFIAVEFGGQVAQASKRRASSAATTKSPHRHSPGPCGILDISPEQLRGLMRHCFSTPGLESSSKSFFQQLELIFRGVLADPALLHALSLVPSLAAKSKMPKLEVLLYRGGLLKALHSNIKKPGWVPKVSTITAMLLLIGYEFQLDGANSDNIATHLRGLRTIIEYFKVRNVSLVEGVQRALFWQDLKSCLTARTPRLISHEEFNAFRGARNLGRDEHRDIPSGFIMHILEWPLEFVVAIQDLNALYRLIDARCGTNDMALKGIEIDNDQANLQSRFVDLLSVSRNMSCSTDPVYEACIFAAYLCTCKLSTGIWSGCPIPEVCVEQIIRCVVHATQNVRWDTVPELLFWVLFVSGGLVQKEHIKLQTIALMQNLLTDYFKELMPNWETWKLVLRRFIWSERAMERRLFHFWEQVHIGWKGPLSEKC